MERFCNHAQRFYASTSEHEAAHVAVGQVSLIFQPRGDGYGYAVYIHPNDVDSVVAVLRRYGTVGLTGQERHLPDGYALVGNYPTGRTVRPQSERVRIMHFAPAYLS
jgi:hypothetical protein